MCWDFKNLLMVRKYIGEFLLLGELRLSSFSAELTQYQGMSLRGRGSYGDPFLSSFKPITIFEGFHNPTFDTSVLFFIDQLG